MWKNEVHFQMNYIITSERLVLWRQIHLIKFVEKDKQKRNFVQIEKRYIKSSFDFGFDN